MIIMPILSLMEILIREYFYNSGQNSMEKDITFTALSDEGKSIWGIKTIERTDEEIVETIKDELKLEMPMLLWLI